MAQLLRTIRIDSGVDATPQSVRLDFYDIVADLFYFGEPRPVDPETEFIFIEYSAVDSGYLVMYIGPVDVERRLLSSWYAEHRVTH